MSNKLAFHTLITALTCLTTKEPTNFKLENHKTLCNVADHLDQTIINLKSEAELNEQKLLEMQYKYLLLKEKLSTDEDFENLPIDCSTLTYGVHKLRINNTDNTFYSICEDSMTNGDWTLILKRLKNSKHERTWITDENGYGKVYDDFFLIGLRNIEKILQNHEQELFIDLRDNTLDVKFAIYDHFSIKNISEEYKLDHLGSCRGTICNLENVYEGESSVFNKTCTDKKKQEYWWDFTCFSESINVYIRPKMN